MKNKNEQKRVKGQFLLLLLESLEKEISLTKIADITGKSKQALNYHINTLKRNGIIEQRTKTPFAKFIITPLGLEVKQKIRYPDARPIFRCHALQIGYEIKNFGTFEFITNANRKVIAMKGWLYTSEMHEKYHVKIQETGKMIISCPDAYTKEPEDAFFKMREEAQAIANRFKIQFKLEFGKVSVIKRGHKSIVGSEIIAKLIGRGKITETEWVDASEGNDELESYENSYAFEKLLAIPTEIEKVKEDLILLKTTFIPAIEALTEQIKLHLKATQEWADTARDIRESIEEMKQHGKSN